MLLVEVTTYVRERLHLEHGEPSTAQLVSSVCQYLDEALCKDLSHPGFDGSGCDNMTLMIVRLNARS